MGDIVENGFTQKDQYTFYGNVVTLVNELKSLLNEVRNLFAGDYLVTKTTLAIGSTTTAVASAAFDYVVNGTRYSKAAVTTGTAPGNDVIPQSKFGAVAFDIGTNGTIDAIEASDNATGYASAALAVAGLPAVAADHVRMGYVTATKSDGAFTFGTTDLDAANTTVAYTDATAGPAGLSAAITTSDLALTGL